MKKIDLHILPGLACILFFMAGMVSCKKNDIPDLDFKQEMRDFVIGISDYARNSEPLFIIIPQNGIELITNNGEDSGDLNMPYLNAADGHGQEDLFYGYEEDNHPTPTDETRYLKTFLDRLHLQGKKILVTDYCFDPAKMDDSYQKNFSSGFISFAADHRELDNIPAYPEEIFHENDDQVTELTLARNFLYLINPERFNSKDEFADAIMLTNYDLLIMDLFFSENVAFTADEINKMKNKANGGRRMVVCYLSIGEAEDYRYYWEQGWKPGNPSWLYEENPDWEGNYKVKYWEKACQDLIFGNDNSYLKKILDAGFDGVYLDIIDAFEYFEQINGQFTVPNDPTVSSPSFANTEGRLAR